ncbi:MAG: NAD(P)H-dependent glycerol-3-phosphate dehydrogenase [Dethiobacter sp.]|jgi:glycerol-3-phosphate dehydrogenase (NAD(P)+)|nr:NAD(P)H-dependent glycerol-3-phosphate dehydrogenase [Dethiobacter sp.]
MSNVSVIGAGSWGTALSLVLAGKCEKVTLWARREELCTAIRETGQNPDYLPGLILPPNVFPTADLEQAVRGKDFLVLVVPSHAVRTTARMLAPFIREGAVVVNCAKGLEEETLLRMSVVLNEELPSSLVSVLSGPNHAEEVSRFIPSASVVSANDRLTAERVQELLMTRYFRVYTNKDLVGVELGGALKNVIALGAGISDGLGFGDNTKAALMTRGIIEIARLGVRLGADPLTFAGLSGIGDLVVTCTSKHSRNRNLGYALGQGKKLQELLAGMRMVAEGVRTTHTAWSLSQQYDVEMPITYEMNQMLFNGKDPRQAVGDLMQRGKTHEKEDIISYDW